MDSFSHGGHSQDGALEDGWTPVEELLDEEELLEPDELGLEDEDELLKLEELLEDEDDELLMAKMIMI